jgi:cation transport ATPase
MSCASCALNVENALRRAPGVQTATVNYADASAFVEYDPAATSPEALRTAIKGIGYDLILPEAPARPAAATASGRAAASAAAASDPAPSGDAFDIDPARLDAIRRAETRALRNRMLWAVGLSIPQVILSMTGAVSPYILAGPFSATAGKWPAIAPPAWTPSSRSAPAAPTPGASSTR